MIGRSLPTMMLAFECNEISGAGRGNHTKGSQCLLKCSQTYSPLLERTRTHPLHAYVIALLQREEIRTLGGRTVRLFGRHALSLTSPSIETGFMKTGDG